MGKYWVLAISHGKLKTKGVPMRSRLHPKIHWLTPMMTHPKSAPPPSSSSLSSCGWIKLCMYVCVCAYVCMCVGACMCVQASQASRHQTDQPHEPREPAAGMRIKVWGNSQSTQPNYVITFSMKKRVTPPRHSRVLRMPAWQCTNSPPLPQCAPQLPHLLISQSSFFGKI